MKTYLVNVTETSFGSIEVVAKSDEEALEEAEEEYHNGNINWAKGDFTIKLCNN